MITPSDNPLRSLDEWDDDVLRRYPESSSQPGGQKDVDDFRVYDDETPQHVQDFYRANHRNQTVEFNRQQRDKYLELNQRRMSIWEAMDFLNTLVDESDPDTDLTQIQHLLGLDDNKLTYFHGGRFKQLSQFGGEVISELLA